MAVLKRFKKHILLGITGIFLTILFTKYPAPQSRMLNIQNYLITVGGIISAFVIAYLSAKIFSLKSERDLRQVEIDQLGDRLTAFRRILYFVMKSDDFWVQYGDIAKFKKKYPNFDYLRLRGSGKDPERVEFILDQTEISQTTITLYLAMEMAYGDDQKVSIPWAYDPLISFRYSLEDLSKYYEGINQVWYFLDYKYEKNGRGHFNDEGLSVLFIENFKEALSLASSQNKGKDFHRKILGETAEDISENVIQKMGQLIRQNTGIPKELMTTFYSLLMIMFFGVLCPLILQSIDVPPLVDGFLTLSFVNLTTLSLIFFLMEFYSLLFEEIHPNKK